MPQVSSTVHKARNNLSYISSNSWYDSHALGRCILYYLWRLLGLVRRLYRYSQLSSVGRENVSFERVMEHMHKIIEDKYPSSHAFVIIYHTDAGLFIPARRKGGHGGNSPLDLFWPLGKNL